MYGPLAGWEELSRAKFFISTMEDFIAKSEADEVRDLSKGIDRLSEEAKDDFWQWHYPIHWQDIFGVRIRSSFVAQLCSHVEALLGDIANRIQTIQRCKIKATDLKGTALEQARKYFTEFGIFANPSEDLWKGMAYIFRIRNIHVHQQGYAGEKKGQEKFYEFLLGIPSIKVENNFIELNSGSCQNLLQLTETFHSALVEEYNAYRIKSEALERLTVKNGA